METENNVIFLGDGTSKSNNPVASTKILNTSKEKNRLVLYLKKD